MKNHHKLKVKFEEMCENITDRIDNPKESKADYYVGLEHLDTEEPRILRHGHPHDVSKTKFLFKKGDILFGRRNWYLRRLAIADRDGICSAHMIVLRPKNKIIKKEFLPIFMFGDSFFEKALSISAGSMSPTMKWKDLAELTFFIPSLLEQEKIIKTISTIDDSITNSQNLLKTLMIYKNSKMNELLTKGIGHKKFKKIKWLFDKEIEIPDNWKLIELKNSTNKIGDGIHATPKYVRDSEYYFINGNNLVNGKIVFGKNTKNVDKEEYQKYKLELNDKTLLLSINGTIGNIAFYNDEKIILGKSASYIICKDDLNPMFLFYVLQSNFTKQYFKTELSGTTIFNLSLSSIRKMPLFLPKYSEQSLITSKLSSIDVQITHMQNHISKLKILKKSILNEKLTYSALDDKIV